MNLLPCPFCGGTSLNIDIDFQAAYVVCNGVNCGCLGPVFYIEDNIDASGLSADECRAKAAELWNRRAPLVERAGDFTVSWNRELDIWEVKQDEQPPLAPLNSSF